MGNRACWILIGALCAMQGCAYTRTPITEEPPAAGTTPPLVPPPEPSRQTTTAPAKPVATLLAKAEIDLNAGQLEQSAATLERALRIAPKDPVLWQRLAEVRLHRGDAQQAEAMAKKSNSLATLDNTLMQKNWRIIAEARRLRGDENGARLAERRARDLGAR